MFENEFNISFNLHKSYVDFGVVDNDVERMAKVYDADVEEVKAIFEKVEAENNKNAEIIKKKVDLSCVNKDKEIKIAYLGDSITSYKMSHQNIVKAALKEYKNIIFKDFAISGYKSGDILTGLFPGVMEFAPDIAVMMIGTNDMRMTNDKYRMTHTSLEEYERNINFVAEYLKANGCTTILVTLPPFSIEKINVALDGFNILYEQETADKYDNAIISVAKKQGLPLVDMREVYKEYDPYKITIDDGLHLDTVGQTVLAGEIFPVLIDLLK